MTLSAQQGWDPPCAGLHDPRQLLLFRHAKHQRTLLRTLECLMQAHKQATADRVGETARRQSAAAAADQAQLQVRLQASPLCALNPKP